MYECRISKVVEVFDKVAPCDVCAMTNTARDIVPGSDEACIAISRQKCLQARLSAQQVAKFVQKLVQPKLVIEK